MRREQSLHRGGTAVTTEVARLAIGSVELKTRVAEGVRVALETVDARAHVERTGDRRDPAPAAGDRPAELQWLRPDGAPMTDDDWTHAHAHALAMLLSDGADAVLVCLNAGGRARTVALPMMPRPGTWRELLRTSHTDSEAAHGAAGVPSRSLVLLRFEASG